ncbi:hypothetical protein [Paenibacillus graminis]|uniref:hypothetical protein n=1 Tax=Paenibacillus graminis TaxID=189425 RepID=UPI000686D02D|nr:hypothetical protein [Paenibacillus graminis]
MANPQPEDGYVKLANEGQSSKDRCDFSNVAELIAEQGEVCPCCKSAASNTTHHVWSRDRKGRGVKTNGLRVCWPCHDKIQITDELLQYWISVYREKYGDHFWFDEKDWDEFNHKLAVQQQKEQEKRQRENQIQPVVNLLAAALAGALKRKKFVCSSHLKIKIWCVRHFDGRCVRKTIGRTDSLQLR